jgi:hypothetical protein
MEAFGVEPLPDAHLGLIDTRRTLVPRFGRIRHVDSAHDLVMTMFLVFPNQGAWRKRPCVGATDDYQSSSTAECAMGLWEAFIHINHVRLVSLLRFPYLISPLAPRLS